MWIDRIIAIIGHLGTWIVAICVLLQLREMAKQRRSTYKPEIVVARKEVYGLYRNEYEIIIPNDWRDEKNKNESYKMQGLFYNLSIYNIGFAAASNICISWDFDIDGMLERINHIINKHDMKKIVLSLADNFLFIKSKKGSSLIKCCRDFSSYDYLLPTNIDRNGLAVYLPPGFIIMTALDFYVKCLDCQTESLFTGSPYITLTIEYKDIEGNNYKKTFIGKIKYSCIRTEPTKELIGEEGFRGSFEFNQQK